MTFFEYKTTLAKIETSNYQQLRYLHAKLKTYAMDNFYSIHAINKTITKFKSMTKSSIIKNKTYPEGTSESAFLLALTQATSEEEIVSLITDFAGTKKFQLPKATKAITHISTMLTDCSVLNKTHLTANYYSIGKLDLYDNISLPEHNRLLPSVICYLDEIKDSLIYNYLFDKALYSVTSFQSTASGRDALLTKIADQITHHKKYTEALYKTYTILEENFKKNNLNGK